MPSETYPNPTALTRSTMSSSSTHTPLSLTTALAADSVLNTLKGKRLRCPVPTEAVCDTLWADRSENDTKRMYYCVQNITRLDKNGSLVEDTMTSCHSNFQVDEGTCQQILRNKAAGKRSRISHTGRVSAGSAEALEEDQEAAGTFLFVEPITARTRNELSRAPTWAERSLLSRRNEEKWAPPREDWGSEEEGPRQTAPYSFDVAKDHFLGRKPVSIVTFNRTRQVNANGRQEEGSYNLAFHNDHNPEAPKAFDVMTSSIKHGSDTQKYLTELRNSARKRTRLREAGRPWLEVDLVTFEALKRDPQVRIRAMGG
jgi:hypothetical protein